MSLDVTQILMMKLNNQQQPQKAKDSHIIAMDRGYWNTELIEYLSNNDFQLLGTHKRTQKFPFTFGEVNAAASQQKIVAVGAKSIYWAKSKVFRFS